MTAPGPSLAPVGTCRATVVPGPPGPGGYRRLLSAPGEAPALRHDLGGTTRLGRPASLVALVQLSDLHVADAQSPARLPSLDRLTRGGVPTGRSGTYRPQESLATQVVEAAARAVRALPGGPASGEPFACAFATGDSIDSGQRNELLWYLALLDGGRAVHPDSGDPSRFEGIAAAVPADPGYWHPDGDAAEGGGDLARSERGFPTVPGLHDVCRRPFPATGLGLPWYAVYGNHDALLAGTVPPVAALAARATGNRQLTALALGTDVARLVATARTDPHLDGWLALDGPTRRVTSDPERRPVGAGEWIAAHREHGGPPHGHGFDAGAATSGRAHYAVDAGLVRFLVLDTVNRAGGWQGSLDAAQVEWLEAELIAGHRRFLDARGRRREHDAADRLFVLLSHHPLACLVNGSAPDGARRVLGEELRRLLLRFPNVVLWLNGHTHAHAITAVASTGEGGGGFWEVTTASLIDWPQQLRTVEVTVDEPTGDVVIHTVVIDHVGATDPRGRAPGDIATLAGWSRELAANAFSRRPAEIEPEGRGGPADRNAVLVVPAPFPLSRGAAR